MRIKVQNYISGDYPDEIWVGLTSMTLPSGVRSQNKEEGLKAVQIFEGPKKGGDDFNIEEHWGEEAVMLVWSATGGGLHGELPVNYATSDSFIIEKDGSYVYDIETGRVGKQGLPWWLWAIGGGLALAMIRGMKRSK